MKEFSRKYLVPYLVITFFSGLYAVAFNWFYMPNNIGFGGITGIAQAVNGIFGVPSVGVLTILFNVPLFLLSWRLLGGGTLVSSLYAMAVSSVFIDLVSAHVTFPPMEPLLASLLGGAVMGFALGIILMQGATTGGTDLAARLLKIPLPWLSIGYILLALDLISVISVALVFRSLDSALYGVVSLFVSSKVMDATVYGTDNAKVAYIISDQADEIAQAIISDLDRGVTILHGEGAYSGAPKRVLMCAFKQRQIAGIKRTVKELDPNAFLIVCQAHEVLGDGFRAYQKNAL